MHEAVLDHRGLRKHAHDLIRLRLVTGHRMHAFGGRLLDQLGAGRLVLDQHDMSRNSFALLA